MEIPEHSKCIPFNPHLDIAPGKFWDTIKKTRNVKKATLPKGNILVHVTSAVGVKRFEHTSTDRWTLGMILQKIHDAMELVSKLEVLGGGNPDGSSYYTGKLLKKINIHGTNVYAELA